MGNTVLRCGGNGYSQQQPAMMIGNGGDGQSSGTVANAYCASNTIIDSLYSASGFYDAARILFFNTTRSSIRVRMESRSAAEVWERASSEMPSSIPIL